MTRRNKQGHHSSGARVLGCQIRANKYWVELGRKKGEGSAMDTVASGEEVGDYKSLRLSSRYGQYPFNN